MKIKSELSKSMTLSQFENGYWYALELKDFAGMIGIPSANKLRKDELEKGIKIYLKTGKIGLPTQRKLLRSGSRDVEKGLSLNLPIENYTSNSETKAFILREARKIVPDLRRKTGVSYRLNRWREEQLTKGIRITYSDLVNQFVKLCQTREKFEKIPQVRYINFLSDFLKKEKKATREDAIKAWKKIKKLDMPKTYDAWAKFQTG